MVINRTHIPWFLLTLLATAGAALLYIARFHPASAPFAFELPEFLKDAGPQRNTYGGTRIGLLFGTLALLIFLFAAALGVRKKKRLWRIGRVELWLKAHVWLTIFTIPLVALHSGFSMGSPHTSTIMWLYYIVMGTGFFGIAMQNVIPVLLKERLPREVVFEQIPHIRRRAIEVAETLQKDCTPTEVKAGEKPDPKAVVIKPEDESSVTAIREFLQADALPYLRLGRGEGHRLGKQRNGDEAFRLLKLNVTPTWLPRVEELQGCCDERRRTDLQTKLQHWLHGWLLIHVPVSLLLIILTLWHAIVAVRLFVVNP
jgi:hypothetical protein